MVCVARPAQRAPASARASLSSLGHPLGLAFCDPEIWGPDSVNSQENKASEEHRGERVWRASRAWTGAA